MERTAPADQTATPTPAGAPVSDVPALLDGVPRQRAGGRVPCGTAGPDVREPDAVEKPRLRTPRVWRLLPTPTGTPFTFSYGIVLCLTSLFSAYADPAPVHALLQGSSTDVAHLVRTPELVLVGSALWLAGGVASPFAIGFVLVLTALERRIGGLRTAGVFLLGHVLATLATEVPVGLAVLAGQLPASSLHRLDYGVSFGVAAGTGALAGLLPLWLRVPLLAGFGGMLLQDLLALTDPLTNWGHLIALAIGIATWPVLRRWRGGRAHSGLKAGPFRSVVRASRW
ncbi:rhomboid-like protein [Streptomyces sp. NPDC007991]|uniref:rhomboid-like protein n=1 Tax=Streptomyces sp. NPDC007991 TaxID=3364803 RepID=UPI0036ED883F